MSQLVRKSEPNKLTYVGELLGGRSFSPKMVSFPKTLILISYRNIYSIVDLFCENVFLRVISY